jgi:hypothetical protein
MTLPPLEARLQRRYQQIVTESLHVSSAVAPGIRALPGDGTAFASTQAAWRFYSNPKVSRIDLAHPLIACGRALAESELEAVGLVVHDWSDLNYGAHTSKTDRIKICAKGTLGYRLQSSLLLSDRDGVPLSPLAQSLWASDGVRTTRATQVLEDRSALDEVSETMGAIDALGLAKPLVHIIDRAGDSVAHYRRWNAQHRLVLVRANEKPRVEVEGRQRALREVAEGLTWSSADAVEISAGVVGQQFVAETKVTITRAARPRRQKGEVEAGRKAEPGEPVTLRLIVSEIRTPDEAVVVRWYLLTNVEGVAAETLARWYYWRWKIESYFKLMQSAGLELEHWQQEGAEPIAKRMLVSSMACVVVWQLQRAQSREAELTRHVLLRLSGRQMRRDTPATAPALLAGMWVLLATLDALEQYSIEELKQMARVAVPDFLRPDEPPTPRPRSRTRRQG